MTRAYRQHARQDGRTDEGARPDWIGPQGKALILELQRLQRALEHEQREIGRPHHFEPPPHRQPAPERTRRTKGMMGRAIDACRGRFNLGALYILDDMRLRVRELPRSRRARRPAATTHARSSKPNGLNSKAGQSQGEARGYFQRTTALLNDLVEEGRPESARRWADWAFKRLRAFAAFLIDGEVATRHRGSSNLAIGARHSFEHELRSGLRVLIGAVVIGGGWAALVPLSAAVVVPGNLVVQSSVKTIQHPTGGIVSQIPVHDGAHVESGDLLLSLDPTQAKTNLQVVSKQLDEVQVRIARLITERDGAQEPIASGQALGSSPEMRDLLASETSLFKARAAARDNQKQLLRSRIAQLNEEIAGLNAQSSSKSTQTDLITSELRDVQGLFDKRLVPVTRLTTLQREMARIDGERGQLTSAIAETRAKIDEAQLQIVRIDQDFRTEVVKELGEAQAKEAELVQRGVAARDMLERIDMRAPTSGIVHQLAVHTIGGVIRAGDTVMEIVPDADDLIIEARLQPSDIDQIHKGQKTFVRFSAFNQRVTPQLEGFVSYVSADTSRDQQTNAPYFTVRVTLLGEERKRLAGLQLVSGMPAEVFLQTGSRTMLSYLFKPITDQLQRAFIER